MSLQALGGAQPTPTLLSATIPTSILPELPDSDALATLLGNKLGQPMIVNVPNAVNPELEESTLSSKAKPQDAGTALLEEMVDRYYGDTDDSTCAVRVHQSRLEMLELERQGKRRFFIAQQQQAAVSCAAYPTLEGALLWLRLRVRRFLDDVATALYRTSRNFDPDRTAGPAVTSPTTEKVSKTHEGSISGWIYNRFSACKSWDRQAPTSTEESLPIEQKKPPKTDEKFLYDTGYEGHSMPEDWEHDNHSSNEIPQYVLDYAPLVHLFSGENFWPCDIADHLNHVTPNLNYTPILSRSQYLNLTNLDDLNEYDNGRFVYLKSDDNVEERPDWLGGQKNIPDEPEASEIRYSRHPHQKPDHAQTQEPPAGGRSSAPAILITVNKGHGIVDAFWFYFYSYNLGNVVLNIRFGNHIGDWEHSLIRFQHGQPKIVFFSEHFFGQAYTYEAVEKIGQRPVVYSAVGTHAMYARPGIHPYILPLGLLHDQTDRGPLWDPLLNKMSYTYDFKNKTLRPSNLNPDAPTEWFFFNGHWGDKLYPMSDRRQYQFAGQYHYVTGPLGPRFKNLGRRKVCQGPYTNECEIREWIDAEGEGEIPVWPGPGEGEGEAENLDDLYNRHKMHVRQERAENRDAKHNDL